ncbi:hypothetical protein EVAR_36626_1 [Eumeta japonica]|uniref:Uncharacterized protein n=1 Tax=Eumeta variegata TaxID=151549 RepID=A0A4C1ZWK4_EUMVA|nr:hypothetical protein EVAR_36626_1 [Eumeta japonica]
MQPQKSHRCLVGLLGRNRSFFGEGTGLMEKKVGASLHFDCFTPLVQCGPGDATNVIINSDNTPNRWLTVSSEGRNECLN